MSKATTAATKEQLIELMQYLSQNISVPTIGIGGGFAPIGTIISYMGTTAPQDYLICDGTTYNIADYKQLSDFFAAQFGSANFFGGDGVTTFKVPDLRGEFLRGTGTNSHTNQGSGENVGVHQDGTDTPYFGINQTTGDIWIQTSDPKDVGVSLGVHNPDATKYSANKTGRYWRQTGTFDGDGHITYTSRPTNTSVLYCIKAVAAGDVYSTTERVVGTWIDGKPVYEKTIDCGALPNAGVKTVSMNISESLSLCWIKEAFGINTTAGYGYVLPQVNPDQVSNGISINANPGTKEIRIVTGIDRSSINVSYVTIRYTKTTD